MGDYLSPSRLATLAARSLKYVAMPLPRVRIQTEPCTAPAVSIIIATYNWSTVLRYAIHSVLWQTDQNFEILVIGDGCTDDSEAVARSFGDARICWKNLPSNTGHQSAPNNAGLEMARGEYIAYLGHDDVWHPAHLQTMLAAMRREKADFAASLVEWIGPPESNIRVLKNQFPGGRYDVVQALTPSGTMHRRDILARTGGWCDYRTIWRTPEADFQLRAYEAGMKFCSTGEMTVFKFVSTCRKDCYRERRSDEQAECVARLERDPWFMPREALKMARIHLRRLPMKFPHIPPPPEPTTPGWAVSQFRKLRGFDDQ